MNDAMERYAAAALALVAWFGVLLQLLLSIQLAQSNGKSVIEGFIIYFGYFTVLCNIFVALVTSARVMATRTNEPHWLARETTLGCATTAIILVSLAYHLLLRKIWDPQGWQWLADIVLHYVVPALTLLYWLLLRHAQRLPAWLPLAWCLYPVAYLCYVLVRGAWLASYPYPFIDVSVLGYPRMLLNGIGLLVVFVVVGFLVRAIAQIRHGASRERA